MKECFFNVRNATLCAGLGLKRSDLVLAERDTLCMHMYHLISDDALGCSGVRFREALVVELKNWRYSARDTRPQ